MKVLFVSHSSDLYGSERSLLTLVGGLKQSGRVEPVVLIPKAGPLKHLLDEAQIPTFVFPYTRWIHQKSILSPLYHSLRNDISVMKFNALCQSIRPELVYSNSLSSPFGALLARRYRLPHIWHIREFIHEDMGETFDWGNLRVKNFVNETTARIICNSKAISEKWSSWFTENKLQVIYNGFDLSSYPAGNLGQPLADKGNVRLVLVGSVQPGKGQDEAVRAVSRLKSMGLTPRLSLVGREENHAYVNRIKAFIGENRLSEEVSWEGFKENYLDELSKADIALCCSRQEAFGRIAVEAMLMGVPLIATENGGLKEIVENERTGLFYAPGEVQSLANCVKRLVDNDALRCQMVSEAKLSALSRFNSQNYVTRIENTIDEVVRNS